MVGEAEVVVGAEVEHLRAVGGADVGACGRGDDAFGLVETSLFDVGELRVEVSGERSGHRAI